MDVETVNMLWQGITVIEAQQMLLQMKISDYPNLKPAARQKLHKEMYKLAYSINETDSILSTRELAKRLAVNGK